MDTREPLLIDIATRVTSCERCPELRAYAAQTARTKKRAHTGEPYWGKPVPAFGDLAARVMLVGLAPGAHGSNRTGRPFTGDASGDFLYPALFRAGFASQPRATGRDDGLQLHDCLITSAARCAPPNNKPTPQQLRNCHPYLIEEFDALPRLRVAIGLGLVGFEAILRVMKLRGFDAGSTRPKFGHGAQYDFACDGRIVTVLASYHPSRQNTNTGVLTETMIDDVFTRASQIVSTSPTSP